MNWKKKEPSDLSAIKTYKNCEYNWCPKHAMWTIHKAESVNCLNPREMYQRRMERTMAPTTSGGWQMHL